MTDARATLARLCDPNFVRRRKRLFVAVTRPITEIDHDKRSLRIGLLLGLLTVWIIWRFV